MADYIITVEHDGKILKARMSEECVLEATAANVLAEAAYTIASQFLLEEERINKQQKKD